MDAFKDLIDDMYRRINEFDEADGHKEFDFLDAVERDLEAIKSTGVIKFTFFDNNATDTTVNNEEGKQRNNQSKSSAMRNVKLERVSENLFESSSEMPPPQLPVKRVKETSLAVTVKTEPVRHTRSKTAAAKNKNVENFLSKPVQRDSDVVLTKEHVSVIMLSDSDDENISSVKTQKQIKMEKISMRSSNSEDNSDENRATMVLPKRQSSIYEDCVSAPQIVGGTDTTYICPTLQNNNATFVQQTQDNETVAEQKQQHPVMNKTIVLNKPTAVLPVANDFNVNDILTDDESMQESRIPVKYEAAKTVVVKKMKKPIFSPFENSPVKTRVAAFEKLKTSDTNGRITRTKTRNRVKQEKEDVDQPTEPSESTTQIKTKLKFTPQMVNRVLPSSVSSASKVMNHSSVLNSEIKLPVKAASALKTSRHEFKEREMRRREKEVEALHKKEELRQMQIEESKRKREERHLKAQQIREEQEKNKQKLLEQQRLKEEKYNQLMAEKRERRQKQQEQNEKKRLLAAKKAEERRQKEEERLLRINNENKVKNNVEKHQPIYMTQKAPLLPTDECYDSDEEQGANARVTRPAWQQGERLKRVLFTQQFAGTKVLNTFFCCESQTPDLRDIFENIDPKKLKRNSSAIWHKKPRFTMFPVADSFNESDENEED